MPRYVLRYGSTRAVGLFSPRGQDRYARGMRVIARTPRGLEAAEVLAEATDEQAKKMESSPGGQIMREMSAEDANELTHLQDRQRTAFETCTKHVARLALPMQLVDLEHVFGGERLVIYYLSEERVDFRDLVKALASEFQTRIEMRQIGVRDEAKLLADYGDCGQPVCCGTFLSEMPPVSMRMAKVQKATLDPTKISGRCGRLKCCLRYEYDTYEDLQHEMPPIGSDVVTKNGRARVLGQEILAQQLLVAMEDNRRILIPAGDVLSVIKTGSGRRPDREERGRRGGGDAENEKGRAGEREKQADDLGDGPAPAAT
jgi:cell fate regulator YaaT (PSP1 superfamily)